MKKYKYDYYLVSIPMEVSNKDTEEKRMEDLAQLAVNEARDRAMLYCIPCNWYTKVIDQKNGEVIFRVSRKRLNTKNLLA